MKKIVSLVLVGILLVALASCGEGGGLLDGGKTVEFEGEYVYNPPTDNYYIEWAWYDEDGNVGEFTDIYARIGQGHTEAMEYGVYHASEDMQRYYERSWEGEYSDWMLSPGYGYSDWKSDFDEFGPNLGGCNAMEEGFMHYFRAYGFDEIEGKLNQYYVGTEVVCGVECWVFDSKGLNTIQEKYWIDPSNGCCLKYMDTESGEYAMVVTYNLNYTEWTDNLAPSDYEGID